MVTGHGIVRRIGWVDEDGAKHFRAVIDFPDGPPDMSPSVIWDAKPVRIVVIENETIPGVPDGPVNPPPVRIR